MRTLVGGPPGSPERPVGYFNPRLDSLAAAMVDVGWSDDLEEEIGLEIQSILREDAVLTFLVPELRVTVFRDWIRGLGDRCSSWGVHEWLIEEGNAEER